MAMPVIPQPPENHIFSEWTVFLTDLTPLDSRNLARWLAANGIELPESFAYVVSEEVNG